MFRLRCDCSRECLKGCAIVMSALVGMIYVIVLGFVYVLPQLGVRYGRAWWLHVGGFAYLSANFFSNYVRAIATNPGTHDSLAFHRLVQSAQQENLVHSAVLRGEHADPVSIGSQADAAEKCSDDGLLSESDRGGWLLRQPYAWGWCLKSRRPKPPRSHYCNTTRKQVLVMDHYCVWVFNCVGFLNYRYFFLSVSYFWAGAMYGLVHSLAVYFWHESDSTIRQQNNAAGHGAGVGRDWAEVHLFFLCLICALAVVIVGPFLGWHVWMTITGQSTIEYYGNKVRAAAGLPTGSPYSLGSFKMNWAARMGGDGCGTGAASLLRLVLLPSSVPPPWPPVGCLISLGAGTTLKGVPKLSRRMADYFA